MNRTLKIAALSFVAVLVLWACGKEMGATECAEKFLTAVQNADWDTAKQYATDDTDGAIDLLSGSEEPAAAAKTVKVVGEEVNGEEATVTYTLDGGAEKTVTMKKSGSKWEAVMEKSEIQEDLGQKTLENSLMEGLNEGMEEIGGSLEDAVDAVDGEDAE
jgi:hypothetical protein